MELLSSKTIRAATDILASSDLSGDEQEARIALLVDQQSSVRRLCDIIPEAFGIVLVSHLPYKIKFPDVFRVPDSQGNWTSVPFSREPVMGEAVLIAQRIYHEGPRRIFPPVAERSAIINAVNRVLNAGGSLEGAEWGDMRFPGIPASLYDSDSGTGDPG